MLKEQAEKILSEYVQDVHCRGDSKHHRVILAALMDHRKHPTINQLMDALLSTDDMADDECRAELAAAGVDVEQAEKRMTDKFDKLRSKFKGGGK